MWDEWVEVSRVLAIIYPVNLPLPVTKSRTASIFFHHEIILMVCRSVSHIQLSLVNCRISLGIKSTKISQSTSHVFSLPIKFCDTFGVSSCLNADRTHVALMKAVFKTVD